MEMSGWLRYQQKQGRNHVYYCCAKSSRLHLSVIESVRMLTILRVIDAPSMEFACLRLTSLLFSEMDSLKLKLGHVR